MGTIINKAPVSIKFSLGFGLGYATIWYSHADAFENIRRRLFPVVEGISLKVVPQVQRSNINESKIIDKLMTLADVEEEDEEYDDLKHSYSRRMKKYSKDEDEWVKRKMGGKEGAEDLHDVLVEFEAVKRMDEKKNLPKGHLR